MRVENRLRGGVGGVGAQRFHRAIGLRAGSDAKRVARHKRNDALHRLIGGMRRNQAERPGDLDFIARDVVGLVRQAEDIEGGGRGLGVPHAFDGGHFHRLVLRDGNAGGIAQRNDRKRGGEAETGRDRHGAQRHSAVLAHEKIDRRDRHHEHRADAVAGGYRVHEFILRVRVHQHRGKIADLHGHRRHIKPGAHGMLHPAIGDENPERREIGAHGDHDGDE